MKENIINKILKGRTEKEIEELVMEYVQNRIYDIEENVEVIEIKVYGSRSKGCQSECSDLDVILEFNGKIREDDLFEILHEDCFEIEGMIVDINPIKAEKSGTVKEYLSRLEKMI